MSFAYSSCSQDTRDVISPPSIVYELSPFFVRISSDPAHRGGGKVSYFPSMVCFEVYVSSLLSLFISPFLFLRFLFFAFFVFFSLSMHTWVARLCMACLSYPVRWHMRHCIIYSCSSNPFPALRCIISAVGRSL